MYTLSPKREQIDIELARELNEVKVIVYSENFIKICDSNEASKLYKHSKKFRIICYENTVEAKKEFEVLKEIDKNVVNIYRDLKEASEITIVKDRKTGKEFFYFGKKEYLFDEKKYQKQKQEQRVANSNFKKMKGKRYKHIDKTGMRLHDQEQVDLNYIANHNQKCITMILTDKEIHFTEKHNMMQLYGKLRSLNKNINLKMTISKEEKKQYEKKENLLELYKELVCVPLFQKTKYVVLVESEMTRIIQSVNEFAEKTFRKKEKEEYSVIKTDSLKEASMIMKKIYAERRKKAVFVDISINSRKIEYKGVSNTGEVCFEGNISNQGLGNSTNKTIFWEYLVIYKALKYIDETPCMKGAIVYTDSKEAMEIIEEKDREKIEEFLKGFETGKNAFEVTQIFKEAMEYVEVSKNKEVKYWHQSKMGTNPAHFNIIEKRT